MKNNKYSKNYFFKIIKKLQYDTFLKSNKSKFEINKLNKNKKQKFNMFFIID